VAELLSVPTRNIALTAGCTRGIADVALSLPWQPGDRLLTYEGEFPANVSPWQFAARDRGATVELCSLPDPSNPSCRQLILDDLRDALGRARSEGKPIRWVAVSAVQFQTGLRMPVGEMAEICHEQQARLFVDGIQGCGVIPFDLGQLGVDAFFVGAHKWLLGLEGAGFFFLADSLLESLHPLTAGWLSHEEGEHFLFRGPGHLRYDRPLVRDARVFEGSTASAIGLCALEAGVEVNRRLGPEAIFKHVQEYHDQMETAWALRGFHSLRATDPELRSCILSLSPPPGVTAVALAAALKERGVMISIPDGLVRLAPHYANSVEEIPFVVTALDEALAEIRSFE
jgi:selenocysteine lyase/cysteine desulfurase